jgi:hypothetical protein
VINEGDTPVAVAFADASSGAHYFSSSLESLVMVFDALFNKSCIKLIKKDTKLIAESQASVLDIDMKIRSIVRDICSNGIWSAGAIGRIRNSDSEINSIISRYLSTNSAS